MTLNEVARRASIAQLDIFGAFHPGPMDGLPEDIHTLVLLGPREPGFWRHVTSQPEFADGEGDALDRWSRRLIERLARDLGGTAHFPFGGPPWRPFIAWARRTGRAWASEVGLLVHDRAGLMVSYRGAVGLPDRLEIPAPSQRPCDLCTEKPCLSACPVGALTSAAYDVPACKSHVSGSAGADCLTRGCAVRRACPLSVGYGRLPEQSAYHMAHFVG